MAIDKYRPSIKGGASMLQELRSPKIREFEDRFEVTTRWYGRRWQPEYFELLDYQKPVWVNGVLKYSGKPTQEYFKSKKKLEELTRA